MKSLALGELVVPAKVKRAGSTEYPVLSMTMHDGLVAQTARFKKRIASLDTSDYKVVRHGQLVVGFPINEGVLDFQLQHDAAVVSPAYGIWDLRDESLVDRSYLKRFLKSPRAIEYYVGKMKGSTARRRSLPPVEFNAMPIPLPPLPEQRRIAAILDHADALRAKRRQVLTHLDALTQSIFNDMFGREVWNSTLGEIANVQIGPFGSLLHKEDYVSGGVPVINPMHIRDGQLQPDDAFSVTETKAASLSLYRLREADVVLGRRGEMGRAGVAGAQHVGMLCGTGSLILRPRGMDSRFLHTVVTSPRMKAHLERSSLGATLPNLNATIVKTSPVPRAPDQAQAAFAEALRAVDESRSGARRAAARDDELFASLQSRAFRGEL